MSHLVQRARFRRDHRWAPRHMSAFLDGELARPQRLRLERHAGDCPDCRSLLAGLRWTVAALQSMAPGVGDSRALPIAAAVRLRLDESPAP